MANTSPIFALVPETSIVTVTAATTDRTGATTANLAELLTAATDGTKITQIGAKVGGDNTAHAVLIFITDTAGANPKLYDEIAMEAVTAGTTTTSQRHPLVRSSVCTTTPKYPSSSEATYYGFWRVRCC